MLRCSIVALLLAGCATTGPALEPEEPAPVAKKAPAGIDDMPATAATPQGDDATQQPAPAAAAPQQHDNKGIPMDKIDEVRQLFYRKTTQVSQCYTMALEGKAADKRPQGKVSLNLELGTDGKARAVKVIGDTLGMPDVQSCVVDEVKSWDFPELPAVGWFDWTFEFKPAY